MESFECKFLCVFSYFGALFLEELEFLLLVQVHHQLEHLMSQLLAASLNLTDFLHYRIESARKLVGPPLSGSTQTAATAL